MMSRPDDAHGADPGRLLSDRLIEQLDALTGGTVRVEGHGPDPAAAAAAWACDTMAAGATPAEICAAAHALALRRATQTDAAAAAANGVPGAPSVLLDAVCAAASCTTLHGEPDADVGAPADADGLSSDDGPDDREQDDGSSTSAGAGTDRLAIARLAAVQLVAHTATAAPVTTLGAAAGSLSVSRHPVDVLRALATDDPVEEFLTGALAGETRVSAARWDAAVAADPAAAEDALISVAVAAFALDERRLIHAAQARAWLGDAPAGADVFRIAAVLASSGSLDLELTERRVAEAAVLAADAVERAPDSLGRLPRVGHDRLTSLATGLARTPHETLAPLLLASLEEGLPPEDLVDAVALVHAAAFAITPVAVPLGGADDESVDHRTESGPPLLSDAVLACTGAAALQRCMARAEFPELRYELALWATDSRAAAVLEPIGELWVPPSDDGGLDDLCEALGDGDPDAAAEAATAVPPGDRAATDAAWAAVRRAAATDQWSGLQIAMQVHAMARGFAGTDHPARIWFLAAAARAAGHATACDQPVSRLAEQILSSGALVAERSPGAGAPKVT